MQFQFTQLNQEVISDLQQLSIDCGNEIYNKVFLIKCIYSVFYEIQKKKKEKKKEREREKFPDGPAIMNPLFSARDTGWIPGLGWSHRLWSN